MNPTTGVGNLPALELQFAKALGRWRRTLEPFSVGLVRLSHPASPNETLPALAAAQLGHILVDIARVEDTVCRVSGNEFAVLLASSTFEGATAFVERARNGIAREPLPTGEGSRFYRSSGGAAQWADSMGSLTALLQAASAEMHNLQDEIERESEEFRPLG